MPFLQQKHIQITRRRNFDCHPDVGPLLSLVRFVGCCDCHVISFARSTRVVCSISLHSMEISSFVLSKLNRYASQTSVKHRLCYKSTISDVFAVWLHVLLTGFSSRLSVGLSYGYTAQNIDLKLFRLRVL